MITIEGRVKVRGDEKGFNGVKITLSGVGAPQPTYTVKMGGKDGVFSFTVQDADVGEYILVLDVPSFETSPSHSGGNMGHGPTTDTLTVEITNADAGKTFKHNFLCLPFRTDTPGENDAFDKRFMTDSLAALTVALPEWLDNLGVKETRKQLKKAVKELEKALTRSNDALISSNSSEGEPLDEELAQKMRQELVPMRKSGASGDDIRDCAKKMAGRELSNEELEELSLDMASWPVEQVGPKLLCTTCWARYNTAGTIYYQNSYYLNQCLYSPPCT